ncbi:MAG: hypothetical protein PVG92_06640 [Holophagae bacterium]|jgi:hypothetical protein
MNRAEDRGSGRDATHEAHEQRPRVVIFEGAGGPEVEVLELPGSADLGASFCHRGTRWQVTATRTGDRVLIARPAEARRRFR